MANWEAHTLFKPFGVGAVLHLLETPQIDGHRSIAKVGEQFTLFDADQVATKGKINTVGLDILEATMASGAVLRLAKLNANELGSNITTRGMYAEDWKVISIAP